MIAAFGTREKQRLNRVMDALNFEYPDYERLDEGSGGANKKRVVCILKRQAMRSIEEDQRASKKQKILAEPKDSAPKKRKLVRISPIEMKVQDMPEKTAGPSFREGGRNETRRDSQKTHNTYHFPRGTWQMDNTSKWQTENS